MANATIKMFLYLSILTVVLIARVVLGSESYLHHSCSNSMHFSINSPYKRNLDTLFSYLYSTTPQKGFSFSLLGSGSNIVYGHALCRGDVSYLACYNCIINAGHKIYSLCPNVKRSVIWYDKCLLKYSDIDFFGQIDRENWFTFMGTRQIHNNSELFEPKMSTLLSRLANQASKDPKKFAMGKLNFDKVVQLFGLVQCTRDLSNANCKRCIDELIPKLPQQFKKGIGVNALSGSCILRFDTYSFSSMFH